MEKYISVKQAATIAKMHESSVRNLISRHKLAKRGAFASEKAAHLFNERTWMIERAAIEAWMADPSEHRFGPNHLKVKR